MSDRIPNAVTATLPIDQFIDAGDHARVVGRDDRMTASVVDLMSGYISRDPSSRGCPENLLAAACQAFRQAVPRAFRQLGVDPAVLDEFIVQCPIPAA